MQVNTFRAVHAEAVRNTNQTIELPEITAFGELFRSHTPITDLSKYKSSYADQWPAFEPYKYCSLMSFCPVKGLDETWQLDVIPHIRIIDHVRAHTLHGADYLLNFSIIEWKEPRVMLVLVHYTQILGDHWLALIDPESVPGRPAKVVG